MKKILHSIGQFFVRIWRWFLDTAWIQVLLIIGVIIGIVMSISPLVSWISRMIEESKQSTFYADNKIDYSDIKTKSEASNAKQFVVIFYSDTCSNCEADQPYIESFAKNHKDEIDFFSINVDDEDSIGDEDIAYLNEIYANVYNGQDDDYKNDDYVEYDDSDAYSILTPLMAWYQPEISKEEPFRVFLGMDNGNKEEAVKNLNLYFDVGSSGQIGSK